MKISLIDRSLYYKGLLLLIRKDREIHDREKKMMMGIGKLLGFNEKFCAERIAEIRNNLYIVDEPPVFGSKDVALCFLQDGIALAESDGHVHQAEVEWLQSVARQNGLGEVWAGTLVKNPPVRQDLSEQTLALNQFEWE